MTKQYKNYYQTNILIAENVFCIESTINIIADT